ncbi:substrate-binding domain-containing protein [Pseudomonas lijiangensis]|uniref:ABC transporter, periplasmic substrate-binding protein n=1 Tax=Pseudomonas cichorii TaxID=36746 RepID=A0A3M4W9Z6_PSECI|nr:substrate-binding domain-containing protein [Pseudomonas cichorii]RMR60607.1 hypothetical protein ALP84_00588 [Pseudomonas cichorii]GFM67053.1 molybdenum ABC transporter substrate-binding protein [Pseudomonas cichorii]GFM74464.1 molybdenum ABC transporter substrate-binding protein [Pseudomonas cichorii]
MQCFARVVRATQLLSVFGLLLSGPFANAADIHVLATTALKPAFEKMAADFESSTRHRLIFSWGASYGAAPDALPVRIKSGEVVDVAIMLSPALDELVRSGYLFADTKVDLATSRVGLAIKAGALQPDISTADNLRSVLLAARSVAFSSGVSGVYVARTLFPQLGIADRLKPKSVIVEAPELVGHALMRGDAEVGLQQMSELLAVPGIHVVGPLPDAAQNVNVIAAAVAENAVQPHAAQAWINYLSTSPALQVLKHSGFDVTAVQ